VPALRLIAWNCRSGSLATRVSELAEYSPDIVFVQECVPVANPTSLRNFVTRSIAASKGIALGSSNPAYRLTELKRRRDAGKAVIAGSVTGPVSFTAIGIWSQAPDYANDAIRSLDAYRDLLRSGPAVVMGDLNSGTCLYRNESPSKNHLRLVKALADVELVSAYHAFHAVGHGREKHPTYRHQFKASQPWHIDFCFVPRTWCQFIVDVQVIDGRHWAAASDHLPLKVHIELTPPVQRP